MPFLRHLLRFHQQRKRRGVEERTGTHGDGVMSTARRTLLLRFQTCRRKRRCGRHCCCGCRGISYDPDADIDDVDDGCDDHRHQMMMMMMTMIETGVGGLGRHCAHDPRAPCIERNWNREAKIVLLRHLPVVAGVVDDGAVGGAAAAAAALAVVFGDRSDAKQCFQHCIHLIRMRTRDQASCCCFCCCCCCCCSCDERR